ncbi:G-type lectin S-receptor-like serine/threonine-protein kinase At1g11410 [Prunus avium]|uniref:G-type lectin S-receptor-like serine/threonine-protein kinase At1g11410 n=1 Tax=Prunus avium TaxID=42229 RepID=A0A6P5S1A9_PRUAV|nr:G-type lectin S-receptor-like serine/threonine-protein kinase At1g11410 [Prunus avium]
MQIRKCPEKKMFLNTLLVFFFLFPFCTSIDTIAANQHLKDGDFIVSKENNFELGFFSPGNSSSRYVGIWYVNKSEKAVVWVANRNKPINDTSGVLTINRYGKLVLYAHNIDNVSIWSTNALVETTSTCVAQLLDTGNLVLLPDSISKSESFIWQSFDYPTDTLLPGMKVGLNWKTGMEWVLTSWTSQNDPGTGNYSLRLYSNQTATAQYFLYKGLTKYWRSDPGPWPNFVSNNEERYYFLLTDNTSVIRSVLTDYGILQQLRWNDAVNQWEEHWAAPKYRCDRYGQCGANSKCSPDNFDVFECECLPGYEPKSLNDWNRRDGSDGCVSKRIGVSNCGDEDGFVKVARVKDPDTLKAAQLLPNTGANECKQACLSNCSCTAYISIGWEGRIDCMAWYGELWDILVHTELGRDLYVRVDKMELAENTRKSKGFLKSRGLLAIPMAAVALVLIIGFACWWLKKKRKMKGMRSTHLL